MKFSIQCESGEKETFLSFREASEKTGISITSIWNCLKKKPEGKTFVRRSDKKHFFIKEERDERLVVIDGEDFYSGEEIREKFGISNTLFFNQLVKKKKHFLDSEEKSHQVDWMCYELERTIDAQKFVNIGEKLKKGKKHFAVNHK